MKLYNYFKLLGAFTNANQLIELAAEPKDRGEKKMLEEANKLLDAGWSRRVAWLAKKAGKGEDVDMDAERVAFYPVVTDGTVAMPLQYIQDYLVRKMAAVQNNASIFDAKSVKEVREVFGEYGVETFPVLKGLVFSSINWSAKPGQKPKVLLHAKDASDEDVCIRFEAAGELAQKILHAALALSLKPGTTFDLSVYAVDAAIERNKRAGKEVAKPGVYVNHNLLLQVGTQTHTGHPPKGQKFVQKPTLEQMETLFKQLQFEIESKPSGQ